MNHHLKLAYEIGARRALVDASIVKEANLDKVLAYMDQGASKEEAWGKAYPGESPPPNLDELLREHKDVSEKEASTAGGQALPETGVPKTKAMAEAYPGGVEGPVGR